MARTEKSRSLNLASPLACLPDPAKTFFDGRRSRGALPSCSADCGAMPRTRATFGHATLLPGWGSLLMRTAAGRGEGERALH
ncbi:hypothetical protein IF1G_06070 [Cordyceps javanica]|uniref:Uncharacterized protein n=1 Tax=Cordyceps javanica TaxID=43265 RepID=A0A545V054_9HYPO|nr:hypothetical protein IF1G_06070 [Cordyceps javanica]